ncbi:OLC1v1019784C1 [Oldenlandia corymbosa var. corymbosa]|uniref:OLC1v1019784C1 n=1 Tax=Oldenlandia corymbosa var. corymbosa TaxID=529605 RepID=A0AAV1EFA9_OLDCO|nr:OLC1v1019784C1 [Oldenlandia corymbosa var. corymbosa]
MSKAFKHSFNFSTQHEASYPKKHFASSNNKLSFKSCKASLGAIMVDKMSPFNYDRQSNLKAFDDTKTGVKGLFDSGITKIPPIFVHHDGQNANQNMAKSVHAGKKVNGFGVPTIDLMMDRTNDHINHSDIVNQVREACENWGFFQVINHGIPTSVLEDMLHAIRLFHEQDHEAKSELYSRDMARKVLYHSNIDLYYSKAGVWKDTITFNMEPSPPQPEEIPIICRNAAIEYGKYVMELAVDLLRLISEALGLNPSYLQDLECGEGHVLKGHYYPPCPEPELTFGTADHTDNTFLTILLQDQIGGLQVLNNNQWVDVPPLPGALVINLGDLLQIVTNDRFKSVHHRVLANKIGPRISVASFFRPRYGGGAVTRSYGPIKELLSEKNPAVYKDITIEEYTTQFLKESMDGNAALSHFKL